MRRFAVAIILGLTMLVGACSKVPSGHVGVKVHLLGGAKGVDTEELGTGRYWVGINEELHLFPTFTQNYVWTKDSVKGSETDESISFQTRQGLTVNADVGISYRIDPTKVTDIFQKYRKGVDEITDLYLRNMVRDALVETASRLDIESVYGEGKGDLMDAVEKQVRSQVSDLGIIVEKVYWIGELRLPPTVVASINAKIEATQKAQQRENEVQRAKAEAQIKIEDARGEAESVRIRAESQAQANERLARSITPTLVQYNAVDRWDGKLPTFSGDGANFLFNVPK